MRRFYVRPGDHWDIAVETGEPACWSWPIPPLRSRTEIRHTFRVPSLRHPETAYDNLETCWTNPQYYRFYEFHAGRCAICSHGKPGFTRWKDSYFQGWSTGSDRDHCHDTGQIRGLLCRTCNSREAHTKRHVTVLANYRVAHPAAILGYYEPFDYCGWYKGWPPEVGFYEARRRGPRPKTTWADPTEE